MASGHPDNGKALGLQRIINATKYSLAGFAAAYKHEEAFRQEVWLTLLAIPISFFVADTAIEWVLLMASVLLVLIVELLNTGLENAIDRFGTEKHELSGRAKDVGSAAVMLTILLALLVWVAVIIN